jgi:hypothetical protein
MSTALGHTSFAVLNAEIKICCDSRVLIAMRYPIPNASYNLK